MVVTSGFTRFLVFRSFYAKQVSVGSNRLRPQSDTWKELVADSVMSELGFWIQL
jgi:hypothetical protein